MRLYAFVLALLLVGAQQSALVHEIGHGFGPATAATAAQAERGRSTGAADAANHCEKCFQFAHVAAALAGHIPAPARPVAVAESAHSVLAAAIAADAPQTRSRGPPVFL